MEQTLSIGGIMELSFIKTRSSVRKDLIIACIDFYSRELNIINREFKLIVESKKDYNKEEGHYGSVGALIKFKKYQQKNDPRLYLMTIDSKLDFDKLIEVLAHEMIHVKQNVLGQMRKEGRTSYWLGKKVVFSNINYYDRPWEIEAWSKEKLLAIKFYKELQTMRKKKI